MKRFCLLIFFVLTVRISSADIVMTPYLMSVGADYVYVLSECNSADSVTVRYGTTPVPVFSSKTESYLETTAGTFVHRVKLTGLTPNTLYYYYASQGNTASGVSSFRTAVNPGTPFRFTWIADVRTNTDVHDRICGLLSQRNSLFSVYGGDLCADTSYAAWKNEFFISNQMNLISRVPFYSAAGNHEGWEVNTKAFTQNPPSSSGTDGYYSFDYGDMHVLVINNEVPYSAGSPQYLFAQSDLSSSVKPWKLVVSHHPGFCAGGHGEDADMIALARNVFIPNHVDAVFSGHSHFYQHSYINGIHYVVLGSAGAPLYDPADAPYVLLSVKDYNYGVIDVTPVSFRVRVYNDYDVPLDSLFLAKPNELKYEYTRIAGFDLGNNYPNPFNASTVIEFSIPENSANGMDNFTSLKIFDAAGKLVADLLEKNLMPGKYSVPFSASNLSSGVYYYILTAGSFKMSKKMVLLK